MIRFYDFPKDMHWENRLARQPLVYSTTSDVVGISGYAEEDGKIAILFGKKAIVINADEAEMMGKELIGLYEDYIFRKNGKLKLVAR